MKLKSLFGLAALALALATVSSVDASHARMVATLQVAPHSNTLFLHGSNFTPGTWVSIAVKDAGSGKTIARDTAAVAATTYQCPVGFGPYCGDKNPQAGQMDDWLTIRVSSSTKLSVRYRDGSITGTIPVQHA